MSSIPPSVQAFFDAAGCADTSVSVLDAGECAEDITTSIFEKFGGLEIGQNGLGQECASSNVRFFTQRKEEKHVAASPWLNALPPLCAIADAHNDHMMVFVDREGRYYFFTDADEQLYLGGSSFGEAMERLLFGKAYGPTIERRV